MSWRQNEIHIFIGIVKISFLTIIWILSKKKGTQEIIWLKMEFMIWKIEVRSNMCDMVNTKFLIQRSNYFQIKGPELSYIDAIEIDWNGAQSEICTTKNYPGYQTYWSFTIFGQLIQFYWNGNQRKTGVNKNITQPIWGHENIEELFNKTNVLCKNGAQCEIWKWGKNCY